MSRVKRLVYALGSSLVALVALVPLSASAASPSPSPALEKVIADPPAGYAQLTTAAIHGEFSAHDYASSADASKQAEVQDTLARDGFVDGFGMTWVNQGSQHVMIEVAMAFAGGRGAKSWLTALEVADKAEPTYKHPDTMTGIDTYYGVHLADTAAKTFGDEFAFVKGNDVFIVLVVSTKDDALAQATSQATTQYGSAPDQTIPTSQWPENAAPDTGSAALRAGEVVGVVVLFAVILAVIGVAVALVLRSRRQAAVPAMAGMTPMTPMSPMTSATPMVETAAPATPSLQMSPDGNFWWDGQSWREAAREVPPFAQRSPDGNFWWDGRTWRAVPQYSQGPQTPQA